MHTPHSRHRSGSKACRPIVSRFAALLGLFVVGFWIATPGVAWADSGPSVRVWGLPSEGDCNGIVGTRDPVADNRFGAFDPADVLRIDDLQQLERFLPAAVWLQRDRFFYPGMRIEIGPCFRNYEPPAFFRRATERFSGQAYLLDNGGLAGYTAGLPFPPETIAPGDPDAGQRWAWNFAHRYRAAGHRGSFRISEVVGGREPGRSFEGDMFVVRTAHRADQRETGYRLAGTGENEWVAGGQLHRPAAARQFSWRQYRSAAHQANPDHTDELHAYIPAHRRVRRLNASWVEGLYVPMIGAAAGKAPGSGIGGIVDGGVESAAVETGAFGGFAALEIRPLLHQFQVIGLVNVLAPINVQRSMYPDDPDRNFGPSGLSFANDVWDLRRALVLEATARIPGGTGRQVYYLDLQTLTPLYYMVYGADGQLSDVAVFAGRWSEDRPDYPGWPDQKVREVRAIDSAAAAFSNLVNKSSWRRESWGMVSVPGPKFELQKVMSVRSLTQRR